MRSETGYGNGFFTVVKATLLALAVSLLAALAFAVILRVSGMGERWIYTINQGLKAISVMVGVFVFVQGEKGWLKGGCVGVLFTGLSYLAFSAIGGDFSLSWWIVVELFLSLFAGVVGGAIAVNVRRN